MSFPSAPLYPQQWDQWQQWQVGQRVMIRYRTGTTPPLTDALGYLREISATKLTLETRSGELSVQTELIVTGKLIPPPPKKRSRSHQDHSQ